MINGIDEGRCTDGPPVGGRSLDSIQGGGFFVIS
jgi:hypothetical protein